MNNWDVEIRIGEVDIYSPELIAEWGGRFPGDASEFENWSEDDKKAVLAIAHRDQGQGDRVHDDPGFAVGPGYRMLLGQCTLIGQNMSQFYDYLLAGLPSGYIDMIVENYFPKYADDRGLDLDLDSD